MKYLCLVYPPASFSVTPAVAREFRTLRDEMTTAGVLLAVGQLQPSTATTTLRLHGEETLLTDGPFAELREQVGGYVLLDCPDLDEAVRWSALLPGVRDGAVEIRPLVEYPD
jgi:hypothetical protein